jgi:hypothetical protein
LSFDQSGIVFTGMIAVWLTQDARESRRRWACIFGIAGQPFWLYATYKAGQWGILATCAVYTWSWWRGVRLHWLRRPEPDSAFRIRLLDRVGEMNDLDRHAVARVMGAGLDAIGSHLSPPLERRQ